MHEHVSSNSRVGPTRRGVGGGGPGSRSESKLVLPRCFRTHQRHVLEPVIASCRQHDDRWRKSLRSTPRSTHRVAALCAARSADSDSHVPSRRHTRMVHGLPCSGAVPPPTCAGEKKRAVGEGGGSSGPLVASVGAPGPSHRRAAKAPPRGARRAGVLGCRCRRTPRGAGPTGQLGFLNTPSSSATGREPTHVLQIPLHARLPSSVFFIHNNTGQ